MVQSLGVKRLRTFSEAVDCCESERQAAIDEHERHNSSVDEAVNRELTNRRRWHDAAV